MCVEWRHGWDVGLGRVVPGATPVSVFGVTPVTRDGPKSLTCAKYKLLEVFLCSPKLRCFYLNWWCQVFPGWRRNFRVTGPQI